VKEIANRRTVRFPEVVPVREVCDFFRRAAVRRIVVVDKKDHPIGMISRGTILRWLRNKVCGQQTVDEESPRMASALLSQTEPAIRMLNEIDEHLAVLRGCLASKSDDAAASVIGAVTRVQELLEDVLAQSSRPPGDRSPSLGTCSQIVG
jgi:CBS domain-containing protein